MKRWIVRGAVVASAALTVLALRGVVRGRAQHAAEARAAAHRPRTFVASGEPRSPGPRWTLSGPPEVMAKVIAEPAAEQWIRGLRDAVCACADAACANQVQHAYAGRSGTIDFSSGDQDEQGRLMQEATACTTKLVDEEPAAAAPPG